MPVTGDSVPEKQGSEEQQYVEDDFEAELLADLEDIAQVGGVLVDAQGQVKEFPVTFVCRAGRM